MVDTSRFREPTFYDRLRATKFEPEPYIMADPEAEKFSAQDRLNGAREAMAVWHIADANPSLKKGLPYDTKTSFFLNLMDAHSARLQEKGNNADPDTARTLAYADQALIDAQFSARRKTASSRF
jgi:hypothetical protein